MSACSPAGAQSLADTLVGGEWTCAPVAKGAVTQAERIIYLRNGEWRSVLTAESVSPAGDRILTEAHIQGTYQVDGNSFQAMVTNARHSRFLLNGEEQAVQASDIADIEQRLKRPRQPMTVESWNDTRSVWTNGSQQFICTRTPF